MKKEKLKINSVHHSSFADLLSKLFNKQKGKSAVMIIDEYNDKNPDFYIARKTFYRYLSGESVPAEGTAKQILNYLGYDISSSKLKSVLDEARLFAADWKKFHKNNSTYNIKINYNTLEFAKPYVKQSYLLEGYTKKMLDERISELPNGQNTMTDYVRQLIDKDMKKYLKSK